MPVLTLICSRQQALGPSVDGAFQGEARLPSREIGHTERFLVAFEGLCRLSAERFVPGS